MKNLISIFILFLGYECFSQNQSTKIIAELDVNNHLLKIQQEIVFHNRSKTSLSKIFLHNWANSYEKNNSPLTKRLLEDYDKSLYFAKQKDRGYSKIIKITNSNKKNIISFKEIDSDIIKINLSESLLPKDSIVLIANYVIKIPKDKFTGYGRNNDNYNLRYWYLTPAVYENNWQTMSNYNIDDLYTNPTDFEIKFTIPNDYNLKTDLNLKSTDANVTTKTLNLSGKDRVDIEITISKNEVFKNFKTSDLEIISNVNSTKLKKQNANSIIERQLKFIQNYLGKYPHKKLLINNITYKKNPVYGFNQLPKLLNPFNDVFEFDIKMFKTLTHKYINNTILTNRRKDTWLNGGIQTFLMLKYIEKYYPEIKAMGKISKIWGVRSYQIAKIDFNEKYPFVYQFAASKNLDQALTTRTDSLSTFNRKIVNKYKAGLGLQYLDKYLKDSIVLKSLKQFYKENLLKKSKSNLFKKIITFKANKDLGWFFGDYINSNKKIDYTIKKVVQTKDSIQIIIKNKSNITVPVSVYGIKNKIVKYNEWFSDINNISTITIAKNNFDKIALNYEYIYPEINLKNNWKNIEQKLFNRPIQFRFFKDIENPYYNQVFYSANLNYNFYDGIIIGPEMYNKALFKKKWLYYINPTYGTKSEQITGSISLQYQHYFKNSKYRKIHTGIAASNFHYAPDLSYNRISPFVRLQFKRKSLRNVGGKSISARYVIINKETETNATTLESENYKVFNLRFSSFKPEIINDVRYNFDYQLAKKFSKLTLNFRYRKLTKNKRQFDFRVYAGAFLFNKTESNFFDFSLNRPSDYLFDYSYLGRSENAGILSQQFIEAEGGFKSFFEENLANQWMVSSNNSINIWRWIEVYGDIGYIKNRNNKPLFKYDSGIRFNFIHNFLEIYLPLQSSNGFEPNNSNYSKKIRYVITVSPGRIYNFIKRGFY